MSKPPYWGEFGPVVDITFPLANQSLDVQHGLGQTPDGFHVVWADGGVYAEPGAIWNKTFAYLRATLLNTTAKVIFYTLRETANEP